MSDQKEIKGELTLKAERNADEQLLAEIENKIREEDDTKQRKLVDENLQQYAERLRVMIANGFTEDQACKIIANIMNENNK